MLQGQWNKQRYLGYLAINSDDMASTTTIVLIYSSILMFFIFTGILKAKYHMEYFKEVFPEKYQMYKSYFSVFTIKSYNVRLQFLMLPYFQRFKEKEEDSSVSIAKKVRVLQILNLLLLFLFEDISTMEGTY